MNRLVVAFQQEAITRRVATLLSSASFPVRAACSSGAEVIRTVRYMGGGVVVMSPKLVDMTADQLYDNLDGNAYILVIGQPHLLEMCERPHIVRLPMPVSRDDLLSTVSILQQNDEMDARRARPAGSDQESIAEAKRLMQERMHYTEAEAHRYLQKQSMNAGIRMAESAKRIIASYAEKK